VKRFFGYLASFYLGGAFCAVHGWAAGFSAYIIGGFVSDFLIAWCNEPRMTNHEGDSK
jgi:hypothetical protein